ncbi:cell wall-binding repeat-containing protein [Gephyromycinifex aptenodytis]|uniref:cell wall-binding repeat-containing protein n=1 Tax=Gephyromycinifex aptenodytis TaxID=2716227 RepID=UPI0014464D18|nr:cell wall-binding repeat-containing protein [Gephyromycinifex aptenodytis]
MTFTGQLSARLGRRTLATAAALTLVGLTVPATSAYAADATLEVSPTAPAAGQSFTVKASGLTKGADYRLALTDPNSAAMTDNSESNTCATAAAVVETTLTCTIQENTAGKYDLKLIGSTGTAVNMAVAVSTPATVAEPVATDRAGTANDAITLTYTPGVVWKFVSATDGTAMFKDATVDTNTVFFDPATAKAGDKVDVMVTAEAGKDSDVTFKAVAAEGYVIPGGEPTHTLRVTSAAEVLAPVSVPSSAAPVKVDAVGTENDAITLHKVDGVNWKVGNTDVSFASNETSKTVKATPGEDMIIKVRALAAPGRAFSGGRLAEEFVLEFTDAKADPEAVRVAGSDRIGTSVEISKKYFTADADTVYIANGWRYADALTAGPAAAKDDAPLLLTEPDKLADSVMDEIRRLSPSNIKIVGGSDVVSAEVENQLKGLGQGSVQRLAGSDRIGTAIAVSRQWASVETAYVAYGWGFPDALSGGSGAAKENAPLMLSLPGDLTDATIDRLKTLGVKNIKLIGGTKVLNGTVANQANSLGSVMRYAGENRYETSAEVIKNVTGSGATSVFVATGQDFPDALAGIPAATKSKAPLALLAPTCAPDKVAAELGKLSLTQVVRLGGADVIADFPLSKTCGW